MTGVDDPYEEPTDAELVIDTSAMSVPEAVEMVLAYLVENGWVEPKLS
jgi:sulfate adenylyltransferase